MSPTVLLQMLPRYNASLSSSQWLDNVVWEEADGEEHPEEHLLLDMNDEGLTFEMLRGKGNIADYEGAAATVLPPAAKVRPGPQGRSLSAKSYVRDLRVQMRPVVRH